MPNSDPRTDLSICTSHPYKILIIYTPGDVGMYEENKQLTVREMVPNSEPGSFNSVKLGTSSYLVRVICFHFSNDV